jgi:hypothetical protein
VTATRTLIATLPSGRVAWLRVAPPLASAASVSHLAQDSEHALHRRRARTVAHRGAIERLAQSLDADVERLADLQVERTRKLRRAIVKAHNARDRKISQAIAEFHARVDKQIAIERETVARLRRRQFWDQIVLATALPLFAAYGQKGRPFGANNIALTISTLVWLVGDELIQALFGSQDSSPYPVRDADAWSYIAPIGNLLAGWWLMHDLQHERFVAGLAPSFARADEASDAAAGRQRYVGSVDLSEFIAPGHFPDFRTYRAVPAVATIRTMTLSAVGSRLDAVVDAISAVVDQGALIVTVTVRACATGAAVPADNMVDALDAAWMVDTADPNQPVPGS